ncbi:MAG: hypothetical protein Q8K51_00665 [Nitrospirota bacterium]|nr:hypothetical protein [Nitrospirota bacterium]
MGLYSCIGPVPVDVVMIDNELFFVLEEEHEIDYLEVSAFIDKNKTGMDKWEPKNTKVMWLLGYDVSTEVKKRKYLKLQQIRYGQKFEEFQVTKGPVELQKNVEYKVKITMGNRFAGETFIITDDNKVIMPHPTFERQKGRTYSVSVDSVLILAAGCVPVEKVSESGGELIQIKQGNVGTFYKLRIGVINIIKADYIDEAGTKKHGLIAVLTLFIEGNPPQEKDFKVHAGQKIIMDNYSVYVEEIRGTVKGLVTLRIEEISKSPTQ